MSYALTSGRTRISNDNVGGLKYVYLFPWSYIDDSLITGTKGVEIASFPVTTIYRFEINSGSFNENSNNDDDGLSFDQNMEFVLSHHTTGTLTTLKELLGVDLRFIAKGNDGILRMGGLYNGCKAEVTDQSGSTKTDLSGYTITLTGKEEFKAPIITNFDNFIESGTSYLLQENGDFVLTENGDKIIL